MARSTVWDAGSGEFLFQNKHVGDLHLGCPTNDGRYEIGGREKFYGDSRFFRYIDSVDMITIVRVPEEVHMAEHVPESYRPKLREMITKRTIEKTVAEEVERRQREKLQDVMNPEDVTDLFVDMLPTDVGTIAIKFDFSKRGRAFAQRALRDIMLAYKGQLTATSPISRKKVNGVRAPKNIPWDASTKWENLHRSQLQSIAASLGLDFSAKVSKLELVEMLRLTTTGEGNKIKRGNT